jgi:hypothetical protein
MKENPKKDRMFDIVAQRKNRINLFEVTTKPETSPKTGPIGPQIDA